MTPHESDADATPQPEPEPTRPERSAAPSPPRPTHPGRPVHVSSGLVPVSETRVPSRPATRPLSQAGLPAPSRPAQRPTSLLGSAPQTPPSRPAQRPTAPLATARPVTRPTAPALPAPPALPTPPTPPALPTPPASDRTLPRTPRVHALTGPLSAPPGSSPFTVPPPLVPPPRDQRATRPDLTEHADAPTTRPLTSAPIRHAPAPAPTRSPRLFVLAVFAVALVLPTTHAPPWLLLDHPSGPTALALAGLLLLPGLDAGPPYLVRWALRLVAAVTLTALATLALADALVRPPWGEALDPLHGAFTALGFTMLVGGTLARSPLLAARIATAAGAVLLLAAAIVPGPIGIPLAPSPRSPRRRPPRTSSPRSRPSPSPPPRSPRPCCASLARRSRALSPTSPGSSRSPRWPCTPRSRPRRPTGHWRSHRSRRRWSSRAHCCSARTRSPLRSNPSPLGPMSRFDTRSPLVLGARPRRAGPRALREGPA